jgi:hypothetical protein
LNKSNVQSRRASAREGLWQIAQSASAATRTARIREKAQAEERPMKTVQAAENWFSENDAEGVAFEYEVIGS